MNDFNSYLIKEAIDFNIKKGLPLTECIFRRESDAFVEYFKYLKENKEDLDIDIYNKEILNTDIGEKALFEGEEVFLDIPFVEKDKDPCWEGYVQVGMKTKNGKEVPNCVPKDSLTEEEKKELGKPQRGGGKKFYVYVKNDKGNVIKVQFGDPGMSVKFSDLEARKSFAARHDCANKKDRTKPGYWSCNLPKYASQLGLSDGGSFFW